MARSSRSSAPPRRLSHTAVLCALGTVMLVMYSVMLVRFQPELQALRSEPISIQSEPVSVRPAAMIHFHRRPKDPSEEANANQEKPTPGAIRRRKREKLARRCFRDRDYGMVPALRETQRTLCNNTEGVDPALGELSTYVRYDSNAAFLGSTVVTNLWVDLRNARVFRPIANLSQDGHLHDPRFQYDSVDAYCVCKETQDYRLDNGVRVWELLHGEHPMGDDAQWQFCRAINSTRQIDELRSGVASAPWKKTQPPEAGSEEVTVVLEPPEEDSTMGWSFPVRYVKQNAIIVGRRDDHNPFFQISVALNAWIMMKVLEWTPQTTQLVYFDDGLPSTTDELQRRILAPLHPVLLGQGLIGSVIHFERAMIAPFEYSGPLMRHLDDGETCGRNKLVQDFRDLVMAKYGVDTAKRDPKTCRITVISRRPYAGRPIQRKWLNEEAILERMRVDYEYNPRFYKYGTCYIQAYDFVELSLEEQMRTIVESDVVVGMHGAGMANVLWSRPDTVVAEIFPLGRKRYGYRNICQFIGCKWFEFRNGTDTGTGDNTSDKIVSYADWFAFFDPLVRGAIKKLETTVASTL